MDSRTTKVKWYKPWTWFKREEEKPLLVAQIGSVYTELNFQNENINTESTYMPPRNILKKKAVKKATANKKASVKRGKK